MSVVNRTITSANSVFTLTAVDNEGKQLFAGKKLEGYSSDDGFTTEAIDLAEVQMGIDGFMAAGYTPNPVKQSVTLMAASPSVDLFDDIIKSSQVNREVVWLSGTINIPATGKIYTLKKGVMTKGQILPEAKKVLQAQKYEFTWESVTQGNPTNN